MNTFDEDSLKVLNVSGLKQQDTDREQLKNNFVDQYQTLLNGLNEEAVTKIKNVFLNPNKKKAVLNRILYEIKKKNPSYPDDSLKTIDLLFTQMASDLKNNRRVSQKPIVAPPVEKKDLSELVPIDQETEEMIIDNLIAFRDSLFSETDNVTDQTELFFKSTKSSLSLEASLSFITIRFSDEYTSHLLVLYFNDKKLYLNNDKVTKTKLVMVLGLLKRVSSAFSSGELVQEFMEAS